MERRSVIRRDRGGGNPPDGRIAFLHPIAPRGWRARLDRPRVQDKGMHKSRGGRSRTLQIV
jgi:hypothetical protein